MGRRYVVVDAFSAEALKGNPVAVVLEAEGLSDAHMQAIARWTNLSETTFVLPASEDGANYHLRIFTPGEELPFAGHPTIGSAHAILEAGLATPREGRLVQQCGVGLVGLTVAGGGAGRRITLELPPATLRPLGAEDAAALEAAAGGALAGAAQLIDVGPVWITGQVASVAALTALQPDWAAMAALERRLGATGVTLFAENGPEDGEDGGVEVRSFAPSCGLLEDPVCGSGNGCVAVFRHAAGALAGGGRYEARQGRCIGRDGRIDVEVAADGAVRLGGASVTVAGGVLRL